MVHGCASLSAHPVQRTMLMWATLVLLIDLFLFAVVFINGASLYIALASNSDPYVDDMKVHTEFTYNVFLGHLGIIKTAVCPGTPCRQVESHACEPSAHFLFPAPFMRLLRKCVPPVPRLMTHVAPPSPSSPLSTSSRPDSGFEFGVFTYLVFLLFYFFTVTSNRVHYFFIFPT